MQTVLDSLLGLPAPVVVILAFLILAGEPALLVGVLLPSVSTALGLGFLAFNGTLGLPAAILTATAAVIAGDTYAYLAGRRNSPPRRAPAEPHVPSARQSRLAGRGRPTARPSRFAGRRASAARRGSFVERRLHGGMNRAAGLIAQYGGRSVFLARWIVGARTLVPRLAGAGELPPGTFVRYSVPTGVLWSATWVGAGYLAGSSYRQVSAVAGQATLGLVVAAAAVVAGIVAGRRLGRLNNESTARLVAALAAIGGVLTALVALAVQAGGLPRLDEPVAAALDSLSWGGLDVAAGIVLAFTPSYGVIAVAAVIVLLRPVTSPRRRGALGLLASGGAVVPLVMLVAVLNLAETVAHSERLFAIQHATSTTAIVLAAWTVARKRRTRLGQGSAWTLGAAAVVLLAAGRIYLGWGSVSSTAAALLIGVAWAGVFAAAWTAAPVGPIGSGSEAARTPEDPTTEHGNRASAVNHAVVELEKRLHLVPVVARRSGLGTGSTVDLEHGKYLLALPAPTAPDGRFAFPTG